MKGPATYVITDNFEAIKKDGRWSREDPKSYNKEAFELGEDGKIIEKILYAWYEDPYLVESYIYNKGKLTNITFDKLFGNEDNETEKVEVDYAGNKRIIKFYRSGNLLSETTEVFDNCLVTSSNTKIFLPNGESKTSSYENFYDANQNVIKITGVSEDGKKFNSSFTYLNIDEYNNWTHFLRTSKLEGNNDANFQLFTRLIEYSYPPVPNSENFIPLTNKDLLGMWHNNENGISIDFSLASNDTTEINFQGINKLRAWSAVQNQEYNIPSWILRLRLEIGDRAHWHINDKGQIEITMPKKHKIFLDAEIRNGILIIYHMIDDKLVKTRFSRNRY